MDNWALSNAIFDCQQKIADYRLLISYTKKYVPEFYDSDMSKRAKADISRWEQAIQYIQADMDTLLTMESDDMRRFQIV